MPASETLLSKLENLLNGLTILGGIKEQTTILPNAIVINDVPSGLADYIIVRDPRDGNYITAVKVAGMAYAINDYVNLLFVKGTEPIAFQHGSNSPNGGFKVYQIWESDFGAVAAQADAAGNVVFNHDVKIYSGNDLLLYSDAGSTLTMRTVNGFGDFRLTSITHINDGDTVVSFGTDIVNIYAGNAKMLIADGAAAQKVLKLGGVDGLFDVDININDGQMFADYGNDIVLINTISALTGVFGLPKLQIDRIDNGTMMLHRESADDGAPTLEFLKRRSGWGVVSNGDRLGTIGFSGADGVDAALAAQIFVEVDGTPGSNDMPGRLIIAISPNGSATPTERLRMTEGGNIVFTGNTGQVSIASNGIIEGGTTGGSFAINAIAATNGNITINPISTGALYLNYSGGSGGIFFGDGAAGITGVIQTNGQMGIGITAALSGKAHIDQASTTAAIPVLTLDQADLSEEFIEFITTVGAGNPIDTAAVGAYYGRARVSVAGVAGFKYVALYDP